MTREKRISIAFPRRTSDGDVCNTRNCDVGRLPSAAFCIDDRRLGEIRGEGKRNFRVRSGETAAEPNLLKIDTLIQIP